MKDVSLHATLRLHIETGEEEEDDDEEESLEESPTSSASPGTWLRTCQGSTGNTSLSSSSFTRSDEVTLLKVSVTLESGGPVRSRGNCRATGSCWNSYKKNPTWRWPENSAGWNWRRKFSNGGREYGAFMASKAIWLELTEKEKEWREWQWRLYGIKRDLAGTDGERKVMERASMAPL